jgi:hypothetical protein
MICIDSQKVPQNFAKKFIISSLLFPQGRPTFRGFGGQFTRAPHTRPRGSTRGKGQLFFFFYFLFYNFEKS